MVRIFLGPPPPPGGFWRQFLLDTRAVWFSIRCCLAGSILPKLEKKHGFLAVLWSMRREFFIFFKIFFFDRIRNVERNDGNGEIGKFTLANPSIVKKEYTPASSRPNWKKQPPDPFS